jgi:hypothetical protein
MGGYRVNIAGASLSDGVIRVQVEGLHPDQPDAHEIEIATPLLVERRVRELIPPCADLGQQRAVHCASAESGEGAYWLERIQSAHLDADCESEECFATSDCQCGACDCCVEAIRLIVHEHFARLNPDKLDELPADRAERMVRIGGVPGKVYCDDCSAIEDTGYHAPKAEPVVLSISL